MIEISHQQARFLIRHSADKRLPEEQWTALQAHLERCAACRVYAARQRSLERDTRRALLARWRSVDPASEELGRQVIRFRYIRADRRRTTFYGLFGLVAALLIVFFSYVQNQQAGSTAGSGAGPAAISAGTPTVTAAPTAQPDEHFIGVVAYQSAEAGSSDIFLLNVTPNDTEKINLSTSPAEDIAPSWSPDGEWLSFLSDRTGKLELFVLSVAGTRLTQLTDQPSIEWQGVPRWSSDGRWIALTGKRLDENNETWQYLVPLDGSGPVSLPGTRGTPGEARFSPLMPLLAVPTADGGLLAYYTASGWHSRVFGLEEFAPGARLAGFDWAFGDSLVYQVSGPVGSSVAIRGPLVWAGSPTADDAEMLVRSSGVLQRSLAFQHGGAFIATLRQTAPAGSADCWTVNLLYSFVFDEAQTAELPGLCALSELESASWRTHCCFNPAGSWLVMAARPEGADPEAAESAGIYALRVEGRLAEGQPPLIERLADLPPLASPSKETVPPSLAVPPPLVRPVAASLNIEPVSFSKNLSSERLPPAAPPPSPAPRSLPGSLLLAQPSGGVQDETALFRADPDGANPTLLLPGEAAIRCPAWSPDRAHIAFLSDRATRQSTPSGVAQRGADELFVMDASGKNITQLTHAAVSGRAAVGLHNTITCPTWSPDGQYLAVVSRVGVGGGVMILTPDGQVVDYAPSDLVSDYSTPVFTPDGRSLLLAQPTVRGLAPRIVEVPWRDPVASRTLAILTGWDDVHGLSVSPDGSEIAFILVREAAEDHPAEAILRVVSLPEMKRRYQKQLLGYDAGALRAPARIAWMQERQVVFAVPYSPLEHHKAALLRYAPADDSIQTLAYLDDALLDWAVNGAWLVYGSESGLWGLPVNGRLDPQPVPLRLSPNPAAALSWR